jgi:hypothetical protein
VNGLLHRLAARATGTTVQVRSDARLPFGGITPRRGDLLDTAEQASASDVRAPVSSASMASVQPHDELQSGTPAPTTAPSLHQRPARRADTLPWVAQTEPGDVHAIQPTAAPLAERSTSQNLTQLLVDGVSGEAAYATTLQAASRHEPDSRSVAAHAHEALIDGTARFIGHPSLLMPLTDSTRSPVSPIGAAGAPRQPAGLTFSAHAIASDEPNEVHIHIGRIEVTAVHEAAPARRRATATPPPMSLDSYFAKRGRS